MKKIPLSQGQFALVDDEDYDELMKFRWSASYHEDTESFYAVRFGRKCEGVIRGKYIAMARVIMNAQKGEYVDHKNHDTLNNQRINLRICTALQNMMNRGPTKNNTSGYKGVHWYKASNKWRAGIMINGKNKHFGYFHCKHEAARVYNLAARMYHGHEFCYTNEIKETR